MNRSPLIPGTVLAAALLASLAHPGLSQQQQPKAQAKARGPALPAPDVRDARYGPHERNVLDLWKARSEHPTPLVVFIHGGGFRAGDKSNLSRVLLSHCLDAGFSVAAINYRLSHQAPFPAPMHDGARAIQFLRTKASEWNLDPARIAATGGSAGAGISLWMGFHDDMADPSSADPVARQSTRLACMGVVGAQSSYDPRFIRKHIGGRAHEHPALLPFYGLKADEVESPRAIAMYEAASAINHTSAGDPPVFLYYQESKDPLPDDAKPGQGIHHPNFGVVLKEKLDALKVECVLKHADDYKGRERPMEDMYADMTAFFAHAFAAETKKAGGNRTGSRPRRVEPETEPVFPPVLAGGRAVATDTAAEFLQPPATLRAGVAVAKEAPTVDFLFFPGQTYPGRPWSAWGDSVFSGGKLYASIGDHLAPEGNAFVYEYDPEAKRLQRLVDVRQVLGLPAGHYTPGKIHGRLDMGRDGWLYFSTHRGSTKATTDQYHYRGDWILRHHPATGRSEVVVQGPVARHCIPASVLDPDRLIFYGGTAPGAGSEDDIRVFAYDVASRRRVYEGPDGPARSLALARSTGRVYYAAGKGAGPLMRFDPSTGGPPVRIGDSPGIRAASDETPDRRIYTVSHPERGGEAQLAVLDTRTERFEPLGPAAVGSQQYIANLDADPTGRYLYYIPGAHGGSDTDGSAVVQYDTVTRKRKVIAFLHPFYRDTYGCSLRGTYSAAMSPGGDTLYVVWNVSRGTRAWDCCALTAIHIPTSERP